MFGRDPHTPLDAYIGRSPPASEGEEYLLRHRQRVREMRERIREQTGVGRTVTLKVGDKVHEKRPHTGRNQKLDDRYRLPLATVIEVPSGGEGAFLIRFEDGTTKRVHSTNLKLFPERPPGLLPPSQLTPHPPSSPNPRRSQRIRRPLRIMDL